MPAQLAALVGAPLPEVEAAARLVAAIDRALLDGFARLDAAGRAAVASAAAATAGSPLGPAAADAAAGLAAGQLDEGHLLAVAAIRAALDGAVHDDLRHRVDQALGRRRVGGDGAPIAGGEPAAGPCRAARGLLRDLAIAGWRGLDDDALIAARTTVAALLDEPSTRRAAVVLDGLVAELRASVPVTTMPVVPRRRWGDLWSRALLLAAGAGAVGPAPTPVTGRLLPLGTEVLEHGTSLQVLLHGVLETDGDVRLVRTGLTVAKVDSIVGTAGWTLLRGAPELLDAAVGHRSLRVQAMDLLPSGFLRWDASCVTAAEPTDPFTTARVLLPQAAGGVEPALERHPVAIAEPVLVEGYDVRPKGDDPAGLSLGFGDDHRLDVDLDRLPTAGPLDAATVASSAACIGLLRFDAGRWRLQPLGVQATVKKKPVTVHVGDWALGPTDPKVQKAEAKAGDPVDVLRGRAAKLLRA